MLRGGFRQGLRRRRRQVGRFDYFIATDEYAVLWLALEIDDFLDSSIVLA